MSLLWLLAIILILAIIFVVLLLGVMYAIYFERRIVAFIQDRIGPNRVGPWGLFQTIADVLKLFFKEELSVARQDKILYTIAPAITAVMAIMPIAVIPFMSDFELFGIEFPGALLDLNVGVLFIIATASLSTYGIILGGWSSGSKYSLIGGLRSSAQLISYELAGGIAILGVVMYSGSLSLVDIVNSQKNLWFIVPQFLGFFVFLISMFGDTNRLPFDLPEAESELVGGYHTEYSAMKWAMYYLGEYIHMFIMSSLITVFFLGGWNGPFLPPVIWFLIKVLVFMFFFMWVRWSLPRVRYDQLMRFSWKVLIPLALLNLLIVNIIKVFFK